MHNNTDEKFVDALIVDIEQTSTYYQYETTKVVIDIRQDVAQNLPTLLTISPALIFLDSKNPKQKINVTSLYRGESSKYGFSLVEPTPKETKQITSYSNDVEEYLNDYSIEPYKNENLDLLQLITDKNASHFILDMAGREEIDENITRIGFRTVEISLENEKINCFRRYPDLVVHRMLRKYCFNENTADLKHDETWVEKAALKSSEQERKAIEFKDGKLHVLDFEIEI